MSNEAINSYFPKPNQRAPCTSMNTASVSASKKSQYQMQSNQSINHLPLLVEANLPSLVGVVLSLIISSITCFNFIFFSSVRWISCSRRARAFSFAASSDSRAWIERSRVRSMRDCSESSRSRSWSSFSNCLLVLSAGCEGGVRYVLNSF